MKTHLIGKDANSSACGRHITFGANRAKSIHIVNAKDFASTFHHAKGACCANCVKVFNERVAKNKEAK